MNEFEFASVLGKEKVLEALIRLLQSSFMKLYKVSNNLLTKSQVILENWRNSHADIAEGKC